MKLLFIPMSILLFSATTQAQEEFCVGGNLGPFSEEFCATHNAARDKQQEQRRIERCNKLIKQQGSAISWSINDSVRVLIDRQQREELGCLR
ncbi:hypothetical protein V1951_22520, partial [Yersinia sp. 2544 StPb PI]|jgi:hypothetical protein|uniref:Uncharacterized protein n=2 Tax=Yersinia intermedia TaxID=631 RepID=A0ABX6FAI4_YERIN|nr:hypothetical protein [Yersinia intermedia]PNM23041.1 hypothetical protein A6J66_001855 [Yersinia enterocolitica]MCW8112676.1 hypothetical protein [Yersinia intermedia]MDA5517643.1 hypothetical protein [Yersinia intermedia]OVZ74506.1 hypothetical protein CBW55_14230 [Yersinia intermedia]OWF90921.1 hypothetical protein B4916_12360 [Yersinia intermedia]